MGETLTGLEASVDGDTSSSPQRILAIVLPAVTRQRPVEAGRRVAEGGGVHAGVEAGLARVQAGRQVRRPQPQPGPLPPCRQHAEGPRKGPRAARVRGGAELFIGL